ncbi:MAG: membrane integrity-associated transporter subunit PqiC [Calditrichaeota bacterium]|nr:membrane integrity-associated transporter subunit PqiC [Calditrichota bacterium]
MKKNWYTIALLALILVMEGCGGSRPSRFFILTSTVQKNSPEDRPDSLRIGIGTIRFPEYLNRPQIVSHKTANELNLAEFYRWAEPLQENLARILAENLSQLIGTDHVFILPWQTVTNLDYRIFLEIRRFELNTESKVVLVAVWQIVSGKDKRPVVHRRSEIFREADSLNYNSLAESMSHTLEILSREMADELTKVHGNR